MNSIGQDGWSRFQGRLRANVGEDAYASWFGRLKLESVQNESAKLSVPTVFLKSWIRERYAERVLSCLRAEVPDVRRIDIAVRACARGALEPHALKDSRGPALKKPARPPVRVDGGGLGGEAVMPGTAERKASRHVCPRLPGRVSGNGILDAVARHYGVSQSDLSSGNREAHIVRPRQVAMYLARALLAGRSLSEIGRRFFGGRDHTSVLHGVNKTKWAIGERGDKPPASLLRPRVEIDQKLKEDIERLRRELQG